MLTHMKNSGLMIITRNEGVYTLRHIEIPKVKRARNSFK